MSQPIVDPHFHFWSKEEFYNANLDGIYATFPSYLSSEYLADIGSMKVVGAVHVEAVVGQKDGGSVVDPVAETRLVVRESAKVGFPVRIVVYVNLARSDASDVIAQHKQAAGTQLVGVRMILNFHPDDSSVCWVSLVPHLCFTVE
jgi:predicted TIM-barrel fold metal-dependent hydrolase